MKTNLVPIRVLLYRRHDGGADWPNLNLVDSDIRGGKVWSKYVDSEGIGWLYDKVDNLGTGAEHGTACTLVPKAFAEAAAALYPGVVSIISEADFEIFHNEKAMVRSVIEHLDTDILQGIAARVSLEVAEIAPAPSAAILAARAKCLDPADQNHRGIRKNLKKTWADNKIELDVTIDASVAQ